MDFIARQATEGKRAASELHLYSAWYCPFAQRAWIALAFKQVDFAWIECTLYEGTPSSKRALSLVEKEALTPGFLSISPRGLVPAVKHKGNAVCDSLPLVEYIEEAFDYSESSSLLPKTDLVERARIRTGISLFNELVIRRFYAILMSPSAASSAALLAGYEEMVTYFAPEADTPFYSPHGFGMFECCCLPWYQRTLSVLKAYRDFSLPPESCSRLAAWYSACLEVEAFRSTIVDEAALVANYAGYAENTAANNISSLTKGN